MEKNSSSEKETHDFMNVDSFSQLPFIRPAPVREKPIRLFGIEFGTPSSSNSNKHDDPSSESDSAAPDANVRDDAKDATTEDSGRKFECHYCCRNFPTSQALGGHQNAHKRERQHAKRAHLQSALAHNSIGSDGAAHHHVYGYGLANYHHRLGSVPTMSTSSHGSARLPSPYPSSWSSRLYGGHASISHHQQQPINGSPLPGLWRIPAVQTGSPHVVGFNHHHQHRDRPSSVLPLPLLSAGEEGRPASVGGPSQSRHVYDAGTGNVHDHVSLDLHL